MDQDKKPNGAVVGLIIIVAVLVVGGIYVWQAKVKSALEQKKVEEIQVQNNSKTLAPIDSADLNSLDADLNNLDSNTGVDVNTLK